MLVAWNENAEYLQVQAFSALGLLGVFVDVSTSLRAHTEVDGVQDLQGRLWQAGCWTAQGLFLIDDLVGFVAIRDRKR